MVDKVDIINNTPKLEHLLKTDPGTKKEDSWVLMLLLLQVGGWLTLCYHQCQGQEQTVKHSTMFCPTSMRKPCTQQQQQKGMGDKFN